MTAPRLLSGFPAIALAALAVVGSVPQCSGAAPALRLGTVARGLDGALYATAAPGDARRLFVVQQAGLIRVRLGGRVLPRPFLDVRDRVSTEGPEQGLLGLAFHPRYAANGRFFVNYTNRAGDTRVVEYRVSGDRNRAAPRSARTLLAIGQPASNHNGGHLTFGPDRMLYVGVGDGGSAADSDSNGQRLDTLLGKLLRIDVDRREAGRRYGIPPDNPFVGRPGARPEVWAYGLRNPWRFSFDRLRGDLWIGDVGANSYEEIDYRPAQRPPGANFGWNAFEGRLRYPGGDPPDGRVVPPVAQYSHAAGCSVTGGYVYRGSAVRALRGRYVYGDFCTGALFTMRAGPWPGKPQRVTGLSVSLAGLTSFGEGPGGELYAVAGGAVYRFLPRLASAPRTAAAS